MNIQKFYVKEDVKSLSRLSSPEAVYDEMKDIAKADQESMWVVYVNSKNMILGKDIVALGGIDAAMIDLRILFRRVITGNAVSFFIVHNHPSGNSEPSKEDFKLTEKIKEAGQCPFKCVNILGCILKTYILYNIGE